MVREWTTEEWSHFLTHPPADLRHQIQDAQRKPHFSPEYMEQEWGLNGPWTDRPWPDHLGFVAYEHQVKRGLQPYHLRRPPSLEAVCGAGELVITFCEPLSGAPPCPKCETENWRTK